MSGSNLRSEFTKLPMVCIYALVALLSFKAAASSESIEDRVLRDRVGTYQELSKRLRDDGPNASFPEFAPVVEGLIKDLKEPWFVDAIEKNPALKFELEEVQIMLFHVNVEFSYEDRQAYPYMTPFEGKYPYRPTIDAIEKAVSLFDKVDRLTRPSEVVSLYHFDRYAYHRHRMIADPRVVIIPTTRSLGFNELIETRSVPIGFIGVAARGFRVDRHYQTPLDFWYHDLNHVRRMVEYLFQVLRQQGVTTFEQEMKMYRQMDDFLQHTLMPHLQKIPLKEDREKYAKRAMLRVIVFEILHESALPATRDAIIDDLLRRPGIAQPFEVMLEDRPPETFNQEELRTDTGNLRSGSHAFRDRAGQTTNIHFIHDRALALLANVYNKLTHGFFDDSDDPKAYVVPVEYRTPQEILTATKELFKILEFTNLPDDGTLLGWITSKNGSPEKFTYSAIKTADQIKSSDQPTTVTEPLSAEEALAKIKLIKGRKQIVTFMGNATLGYEHPELVDELIIEKLRTLNPRKHIINSGSTKDGISRVYDLAHKMGFETMGVVSTQALQYTGQFASNVDHHIIVADGNWGGRRGDGSLNPVTNVFVQASDEMIAIGGGMNTAVTIQAFEAAGKRLSYRTAEVNHDSARREALYKRQPAPTSFEGAAFKIWKDIAAQRVAATRAALCEANVTKRKPRVKK